MKIIIMSIYYIENIFSLSLSFFFSLPLRHLGYRVVEQGIINLAYCFGDDLLTL